MSALISQEELAVRFEKVKKLLCELRDTFLRWSVIEADGVVPRGLLTIEVGQDLDGKKGLLRVVFHGNKCGCFFTPEKDKEVHWTNLEADSLIAYEEIVFSIWDYSTGCSLEKRSEWSTAEWYVDDQGTANRFEDIASRIDKLLVPLNDHTHYALTVATISRSIRNLEQPKWKPSRVYWGFVKNLDEAIKLCETKMAVTDVKERIEEGLESKPPEFLQNILWILQNWKKHLEILILAGLILLIASGIFVWPKFDLLSKLFNSQKETPKTEVKTSGDSSPAIISTGPNSPVTVNYGGAEDTTGLIRIIPNATDNNVNGVLSDLHQKRDLRKLEPLETGKNISETAPGTYFYVYPMYLDFKEGNRDEQIGSAKVNSLWYLGYFELQKHTNGNICLLGYVSSESGAKIAGPIRKTDTDIVACPQPWREFNTLAVIPVSRISKCASREITITEDRRMQVLDLRIK